MDSPASIRTAKSHSAVLPAAESTAEAGSVSRAGRAPSTTFAPCDANIDAEVVAPSLSSLLPCGRAVAPKLRANSLGWGVSGVSGSPVGSPITAARIVPCTITSLTKPVGSQSFRIARCLRHRRPLQLRLIVARNTNLVQSWRIHACAEYDRQWPVHRQLSHRIRRCCSNLSEDQL